MVIRSEAVAVARKRAVLLLEFADQRCRLPMARPVLVAHRIRAMQFQAGQPDKKGKKRGAPQTYMAPIFGNSVPAADDPGVADRIGEANAPISRLCTITATAW